MEQQPLIVSGLTRFPVKSFSAEHLSTANIQYRGMLGDRCFMVVDDKGVFITQRKWSAMALVQAKLITENGVEFLLLSIPGFEYQKIPLRFDETNNKNFIPVTVWNDTFLARVVCGSVNQMLSDFLGLSCNLVEMNRFQQRKITHEAVDGIVSFADAFPYLLIGTQSLNHLNDQLIMPVSMGHFRPNIVVSTSEPNEEDQWNEIKVGSVVFKNVALCSRCVMTTINPLSANRDKNLEPLKTLSNYRSDGDGKIMFGVNLVALNEGSVSVDDVVEVLSYQ